MSRLMLLALALAPAFALSQSAPPQLPGTPQGVPPGQTAPPALPGTPTGAPASGASRPTPPLPGTPSNDPLGRATPVRVLIANKDARTESLPVTITGSAEPVRVAVTGGVGVARVLQRWEYMQLVVRDGTSADGPLNTLGDQGWELVEAVPGAAAVTFVFKRPK
jgi:hypothetical protein